MLALYGVIIVRKAIGKQLDLISFPLASTGLLRHTRDMSMMLARVEIFFCEVFLDTARRFKESEKQKKILPVH